MKTVFQNGNQSQGIQGTVVTAEWLNMVFSHRHDGIDDDGHAPLNYGLDVGVNDNAYVIGLTPPLTAHVVGMPIIWRASRGNTGAATLKVNDLSAVPLRKFGGTALSSGDIAPGQMQVAIYDGACYQILPGMVASLYGSATQQFSAADGETGKQVVNISQFGASFGATGWQRFPSGLIIQWGAVSSSQTGSFQLTFPITFPYLCYGMLVSRVSANVQDTDIMGVGSNVTVSGATVFGSTDADAPANMHFCWMALGR